MRFPVQLAPGNHRVPLGGSLSIQPLIDASAAGRPVTPLLLEIIGEFGFHSFTYLCLTGPRADRDSQYYSWTTQPQELIDAYDRNAFLEVDPRVSMTLGRTTPCIWDAATIDGGPAVRQFLDYMGSYGIRSGVAIPISDGTNARIGVGFNSNISPIDCNRHTQIERILGSLVIFAAQFHDHFVAQVIARGVAPSHRGMPLSARELQCLSLAANGLTSVDVGAKLGISERTANFHFANIVSKLGVQNRSEAIAKAISMDLVHADWPTGKKRTRRPTRRGTGPEQLDVAA